MNRSVLTPYLENKNTCYVYDLEGIRSTVQEISAFHSPMFFSRYAMKANSNAEVMEVMRTCGIGIDCCSEFEVQKALEYGFSGTDIQISSQQCPKDRAGLQSQGISCVATSLLQLERYGQSCPGSQIGLRINPGQGSGQFAKVNTGGEQSSFGIWHAYIDEAKVIAERYNLCLHKLHIHIGSGADTQTWLDMLSFCLDQVLLFPEVTTLNMGGGYKVARMSGEQHCNLPDIITQALAIITQRSHQHARVLKLEIEPGTYFVANQGYIVCEADDIVDTGPTGYRFVRTTTGMDMIIRPTMYAAQHPIYHFSHLTKQRSTDGSHQYVFVGHCCESSDLLTPQKNNPEAIATRGFNQEIHPGDRLVIGGAGAYCESMRCVGYNGFF